MRQAKSKVPEPPAQSIAEVLESVAVKVEEAPIFEDAPEEEAPELDSLSKAATSGLLTAVREEGFVMLYRSLAMQEDYILKDKKLIINVPDNAGWSILTRKPKRQAFRRAYQKDDGRGLRRRDNPEDNQGPLAKGKQKGNKRPVRDQTHRQNGAVTMPECK